MTRRCSSWPIVAGGAIAKFQRSKDGSTWRDRAHGVAMEAIAEAGLVPSDIDALVVASESDLISLQVNPSPVVASDLGLPHVSAVRVEGGGASGALAVRAGVHHILSGLYSRVLVVGFDDAASHLDNAGVGLVYGLSFDAEVDGFLGATAAALYAVSAAEHMRRYDVSEHQLAAVAVKNRHNALANPNAHLPMDTTIDDVLASPPVAPPLKRLDCSPLSDGAAALVLASDASAPGQIRSKRVRITASACAGDWARIGDRSEFWRFAGKSKAASLAYAQASIASPRTEIHVAEVYDAFTTSEIQSLEALNFADEGQAGTMIMDGEFGPGSGLPVNLSGGLLGQGASPGAVGIAQIVTIAKLLQGRYYPQRQPRHLMRRGLAEAHGGIATTNCVHILEVDE
ncbi:MAG: thiolase family protein [Hyphomicrobiaceae bacterium]